MKCRYCGTEMKRQPMEGGPGALSAECPMCLAMHKWTDSHQIWIPGTFYRVPEADCATGGPNE